MSSTSDTSLSSLNNTPVPPARPRERLGARLKEAGLSTARFVRLQPGTKESHVKHNQKKNQYHLNEIPGTYGVLPLGELGFVDIDSFDALPDPFSPPPTFTVNTPHGGIHYYYRIIGSVSNTGADWGELRVNNWYVVGPGSEITQYSKADHDCSAPGEGQYERLHDQPIATLTEESLAPLRRSSQKSDPETRGQITDPAEPVGIDNSARIKKAREVEFVADLIRWAETGDRSGVTHLYDSSRSSVEYQLARQG